MIYRLVVADSSPSVRRAVELAFPESEFEVFFFDNGLELVRALPDIRPDALLISLSLPGLDGYQAGGTLRGDKDLRQTSLFFLRGAFERFETEKAAGLDYEAVVRKPFDSEGLAARVRDVLDRKHDLMAFPRVSLPDKEEPAPAAPDGPRSSRSPDPAPEGGGAGLDTRIRREVSRALAESEKRLWDKLRKEIKDGRAAGTGAVRQKKQGKT